MSDADPAFFADALLVEDELELAATLTIALRKLGIPSRHAATLTQAHELMQASPPELIVLDRMLPDGDGFDFCRRIRIEGFSGTILILTAAAQIEDRVRGLNSGADDYLPKPFAWEEMEARLRALARRKPAPSATPWLLDPERIRIRGPRGWVTLTPLEYKLASTLIEARGNILARDELLKKVWGFTLLPKTRTVDHFLGRLRKHFESDAENPVHFLTVRGAGYRFEP